jgi:hypothetical protein
MTDWTALDRFLRTDPRYVGLPCPAADLDATDRVRDLGTLKRDSTTLVM